MERYAFNNEKSRKKDAKKGGNKGKIVFTRTKELAYFLLSIYL